MEQDETGEQISRRIKILGGHSEIQAVRGRLMAGIDDTPTSAQELAAQQQPGPHSRARQEPVPEVLDKSLALTLPLQFNVASVVLIQHQL